MIFFLVVIFSYPASSQYKGYHYTGEKFNPYLGRFSYALGGGISAYSGEMSGFFQPKRQNFYFNPSFHFGFGYRVIDHFIVKAELNAFRLYAEIESENDTQSDRIFKSFNFDYSLLGALDLFAARRIDGRFYHWNIQAYGGVGQVLFFPDDNNPGGTNTGVIIQDSTSSRTTFKRASIIFPVGMSFQYFIDKNHSLSIDGIYRFTRTDFMDALQDLSHPDDDAYFTLLVKFTVIIDPAPGKNMRYDKYIKRRKSRSAGK